MEHLSSRILLRPALLIPSFVLSLHVLTLHAAACEPYKFDKSAPVLAREIGDATFYGKGLKGDPTASGEPFNPKELVAAHPSYPLGTLARVINLDNGCVVDVRIIDRGPGEKPQEKGVVIDLSTAAARALHFVKAGKTPVKVEILKWGKDDKPPI